MCVYVNGENVCKSTVYIKFNKKLDKKHQYKYTVRSTQIR
jgi:hypothetical protein